MMTNYQGIKRRRMIEVIGGAAAAGLVLPSAGEPAAIRAIQNGRKVL
jgi:hypothetical protein